MNQDIVYILGIIVAILLVLIFLRSMLLRRQRLAAAQATTTLTFIQSSTTGGEWGFRRDPGMDVVRPEPAVINLRTLPRTRAREEQNNDQLPLYEAPPPDYDTIPKDLERGEGGIIQRQEQGESSRVADSAPPGYGGDDEIRAAGNNTAPAGTIYAVPENPPVNTRGLFRVDIGRAWGGFGRHR